MIETMSRVRGIHRDLLQENEAEPTMEQTAEAAGISAADAANVMRMSRQPLSLDQPVGDHDDTYFGEFLQDYREDDPLLEMNNELLKARIADVLEGLDYREREIIRLRYGLADGYAYTLEEVGKIFSVTRERVRQIETKAVRSLQHPIRADVVGISRSRDERADGRHAGRGKRGGDARERVGRLTAARLAAARSAPARCGDADRPLVLYDFRPGRR